MRGGGFLGPLLVIWKDGLEYLGVDIEWGRASSLSKFGLWCVRFVLIG